MQSEDVTQCIEEGSQTSSSYGASHNLSHVELTELFQQSVKQMVTSDPLLKDLHLQVTLDEVEAILALEQGQAITVIAERANGDPWKVVVSRDSTLHQLKLALKHHVTLHLARQGNFKKLSWKYIWRTYDLNFNGIKLLDNNKKLMTYGLYNKCKIAFVKKITKVKKLKKICRKD